MSSVTAPGSGPAVPVVSFAACSACFRRGGSGCAVAVAVAGIAAAGGAVAAALDVAAGSQTGCGKRPRDAANSQCWS